MIELPRDAGGREIPLNTEVLYDRYGFKNNVKSFTYFIRDNMWRVRFTISTSNFAVSDMYLTEPDSWEKLEEDLSEAGDARYQEACAYFHRDKDEDGCVSCPGGEDGCARIVMRDIASRIRKLRGED